LVNRIIGIFTNPCIFNARQQAKRWKKKGYRVRIGHGIYKDGKKTRWYIKERGGSAHQWAEYFDPKQQRWLMCKDTIKYVDGGYPIDSYGKYYVDWYGEF